MLYNLKEYHRPTDVAEAYELLQRKHIRTVPLASGISVVGKGASKIEAVVDLSNLGLDFIDREDNMLHLGTMVRLQTIVDELADVADGLLADTAHRMAGAHIRRMSTIGSILATGDIHTPLSVALAALSAQVRMYLQPGALPDWQELATKARLDGLQGQLITTISVKLQDGMGAGYEQVARTPADLPIVCAAAIAYPINGNGYDTYTAVGGLLRDLTLLDHTILEDDPTDDAIESVVERVIDGKALEATYLNDYRGSSEYRKAIAPVVARRALEQALVRAGARPVS